MKIPKHVAIIMDGNGRWAQRRHHPRVYGHIRGASRIKTIVKEADQLGIKALTLFAFSTENWGRPEEEKSVLWKLFMRYLAREVDELNTQNVRLRVIGEVERLSSEVRAALDPAILKLQKNTGLQLNLAISYGSRAEIVMAAQAFAQDCAQGRVKPEQLNDQLFSRYLWTSELNELADVDLVIRTSGEQRVSNFLLWQAAYAEYVFTDTAWPDFSALNLRDALKEYQNRDRRFGKVKSVESEESLQWKSS